VRVYTVRVRHEWIGPECGRPPGRIRLSWLEIHRNEHAGAVPLIGEGDPLLCQHSQELITAEVPTVHLESQAPQGVWCTVGTLSELAASRELPIRRDDLLHDDSDIGQGKFPEYAPQLAQPGSQFAFDLPASSAVRHQDLNGNAAISIAKSFPATAQVVHAVLSHCQDPLRDMDGERAEKFGHVVCSGV
jgi:hypothetical protein